MNQNKNNARARAGAVEKPAESAVTPAVTTVVWTPSLMGKKAAANRDMRELGQRGGLAAKGKSGRQPKPTNCARCGLPCVSATAARLHCRKHRDPRDKFTIL